MKNVKSNKNVSKHLAMIQDVVNRMGYKSFLIKGWSFVLITISSALLIRQGDSFFCSTIIIDVHILFMGF